MYLRDDEAEPLHDCERCGLPVPVRCRPPGRPRAGGRARVLPRLPELRRADRPVRLLVAAAGGHLTADRSDRGEGPARPASFTTPEDERMHHRSGRLEVWAGPECTVNRVGDRYFDQLARTGHDARPTTSTASPASGVQAVRYPVLWERHAADPTSTGRWADARLEPAARARRPADRRPGPPRQRPAAHVARRPVVRRRAGRVRRRGSPSGSRGSTPTPRSTSRSPPPGSAACTATGTRTAATTATFARCLLTQCRAVVLAMRAVRAGQPGARLVQTEDLGQTHATPRLRYQADFENERRWLTWDLLCGRVDRRHPLWGYLRWARRARARTRLVPRQPVPARRPRRQPLRHQRALPRRPARPLPGRDARRQRPAPVRRHRGGARAARRAGRARTGCSGRRGSGTGCRSRSPRPTSAARREEQVRWLCEVWRAAPRLRGDGADVRAVTAWSVFGAYDWDCWSRGRAATTSRACSTPRRPAPADGPGRRWSATWPPAASRTTRSSTARAGGAGPSGSCIRRTPYRGGARRAGATVRARAAAADHRGRRARWAGRSPGSASGRGLPLSPARPPASWTSPTRRRWRPRWREYRPWAVVNAAGYVRVDDAEARRRAAAAGRTPTARPCWPRPAPRRRRAC